MLRPAIIALLSILTACALGACAKPRYIIAGLTLPPGAKVVKSDDQTYHGCHQLWVSFNCPGGWDMVMRHIDKCMQRAGYTETSSDMAQQAGGASSPEQEGFEELNPVMSDTDSHDNASLSEAWNKYHCVYKKLGVNQIVELQYYTAYMEDPAIQAARTGFDYTKFGFGDYILSVVVY
jgi:hypothetical protein